MPLEISDRNYYLLITCYILKGFDFCESRHKNFGRGTVDCHA
jgi:hypothetical protein